jgi:hypothetical protein
MSTAPILSSQGQQAVQAEVRAHEKANLQHMKVNTALATGGFAAAALLMAVCPPAGLGFAVATLAAGLSAGLGAIFSAKAVGNVMTNKHLEQISKTLAHPAIMGQLQKKARKMYKMAKAAGIVSNVGAVVALGALVSSVFAPSLALPILYNVGMAAFGGGALTAVAAGEAKKDATEIRDFAVSQSVTPPPAANQDAVVDAAPRALTRMTTLSRIFGGVSAPTVERAPVPAAPAFKPQHQYLYA